MATYWIKYPRNFANEFSLLRADTEVEAAAVESHGYDRITRKDAVDRLSRHIGIPARVLTDPDATKDDRWGYDALRFSAASQIGEWEMDVNARAEWERLVATDH